MGGLAASLPRAVRGVRTYVYVWMIGVVPLEGGRQCVCACRNHTAASVDVLHGYFASLCSVTWPKTGCQFLKEVISQPFSLFSRPQRVTVLSLSVLGSLVFPRLDTISSGEVKQLFWSGLLASSSNSSSSFCLAGNTDVEYDKSLSSTKKTKQRETRRMKA